MTYTQFQEHFEQAAAQELAQFDSFAIPALLAEIEAGHLGEYYSIWRSLGARANAPDVNEKFFAFLESDTPYLHRYPKNAAAKEYRSLIQ